VRINPDREIRVLVNNGGISDLEPVDGEGPLRRRGSLALLSRGG